MFLAVFMLIIIEKCYCFNLDTNFVDIINIGNEIEYFGFSVLLQKGSTSSVLVGAPKANLTHLNQIKEPGAVYKCDIGEQNSCIAYVIDGEGNTEHQDGDTRYNYKNKKDGAQLGATLAGGEHVGDPFFVCSPKWVNERTDKNGQHYLGNGMCYHVLDSRNVNESAAKLMPLLNAGKQGYTIEGIIKYYYALGEVGFSMDYVESRREITFGAPGVLSWKGTVVRYKDIGSSILPPLQRLVQYRTKRQIHNEVDIPNPVYISTLKEENIYFGYALSSGRFITRSVDIWYVSGAPRAEELYGLVLLYEFSPYHNDDSDLQIRKKLVGDQLGSYFGASLLSIDTSQKGADDLLVGAPTYFTETWDEGCVYFYRNDGQGNLKSPLKIFGSKRPGARFGTTITSIGDINQDTYQDVAISAPYEDGSGAVYIYLGSKNGLLTEFNQKIAAKAIDTTLRGFGFSISKGVDIDQNSYNDIAVGAYISGQVAIIKSRPVIEYFATLTPNAKELAVNTAKFNVTYCIRYSSTSNNVNYVDTNIQIIKDSRAINDNDILQTVTLTMGNDFCGNVEIMLKGGRLDYTKSFSLEMIYSISNSEHKEFCPTCPVTNPSDNNSTLLIIPFANGCGDDNTCEPDLNIRAHFENNMISLVIGSKSILKVLVLVENKGEPAYLCQVHMKLPPNVEIARISSKCELSEDRIYHCIVDNVLQPQVQKQLTFDLDVKNLNPKDTNLTLNITVDSKGEEVNFLDNSFTIELPLTRQCNVDVGGKSLPDQIAYVNENNEIKYELVNFTHEFSFKNLGPSPLLVTTVNFYLPVELDDSTLDNTVILDVYEPQISINRQPIQCKTDYNFGFFTDNERITGKESNINDTTVTRRLKRNTENYGNVNIPDIPNIITDLPVNRTLFLNCSNRIVKCMKISCTSDETIYKNQYVTISIAMKAHIDILQQILNNKDIILISSTAQLSDNVKFTQNFAKTILIGSLMKEEVSYWIYIICVIAAVLILGIIVFTLYKFNFFNRPVREKLQNQSETSSIGRNLDDDDDDDDNNSITL